MKSILTALLVASSFAASAETFILENANLNYVDCGGVANQVYSVNPEMTLASVTGVTHFTTSTGTGSNTFTGMLMGASQALMKDAGICDWEDQYPQTTKLKLTIDSSGDLYQIVKIEK